MVKADMIMLGLQSLTNQPLPVPNLNVEEVFEQPELCQEAWIGWLSFFRLSR